jgi:hypothetical protein
MQTRFYDYGRTYYSPQHNDARYGVMSAGPYRGFGLSVDALAPTNLVIAAGYGILHDGYEWKEDASTVLAFAPQVAAATFSICATHTDRLVVGGASVAYEIRAGYFTTIADGVVLGWIYYPGGSIPLAAAHLMKAPNLLSSTYITDFAAGVPIERIAPFHNQNACYTDPTMPATGPDLTLTALAFDVATFTLHQDITRAAAGMPGVQWAEQHLQYYMNTWRPESFDFWLNIDADPNTFLTVRVYDTAQAAVGAAAIIAGTGAWTSASVTPSFASTAAATFNYGEPYTLRIRYDVGQGQTIRLARVAANFWPL